MAQKNFMNRGRLYSFTVFEERKAAPAGFGVPDAFGYIDLPDGEQIAGMSESKKRLIGNNYNKH